MDVRHVSVSHAFSGHPRTSGFPPLKDSLGVVCTLGVLMLCRSPLLVAAADTPLAVMRTTIEQVMAVLQNPASQGAVHRQERFAKVQAIVLARFDTQEMAKRTLGVHWSTRTAAEQAEFTHLFTDLVEKSY